MRSISCRHIKLCCVNEFGTCIIHILYTGCAKITCTHSRSFSRRYYVWQHLAGPDTELRLKTKINFPFAALFKQFSSLLCLYHSFFLLGFAFIRNPYNYTSQLYSLFQFEINWKMVDKCEGLRSWNMETACWGGRDNYTVCYNHFTYLLHGVESFLRSQLFCS